MVGTLMRNKILFFCLYFFLCNNPCFQDSELSLALWNVRHTLWSAKQAFCNGLACVPSYVTSHGFCGLTVSKFKREKKSKKEHREPSSLFFLCARPPGMAHSFSLQLFTWVKPGYIESRHSSCYTRFQIWIVLSFLAPLGFGKVRILFKLLRKLLGADELGIFLPP